MPGIPWVCRSKRKGGLTEATHCCLGGDWNRSDVPGKHGSPNIVGGSVSVAVPAPAMLR